MHTDPAAHLDDETVLRILAHLTADMRDQLPSEARTAVASPEEARAAIAVFLEEEGVAPPLEPDRVLPEPAVTAADARVLLQMMWEDDALRRSLEALIAEPPDESQKSVEVALAGAVILGGLITWLQTRIDLQVSRTDGMTSFRFRVRKDATDPSLIREMATKIASLVIG